MTPPQLNFQRATYQGDPVPLDHCVFCGRGVTGEFYRTNGDLTCTVCATHLRSVLPRNSRQVFLRSCGLGILTATGASLAYLLLFRLLAPYGLADNTIFASLAVGYAIGRAMQLAGPGARGRRYQIMAAFLTYAAVSLASGAAMLALHGAPLWAYPFLVLTPIAMLFAGHAQQGGLILFFIALGIRWAWALLRPHGIQITGPETIPSPSPGQK